MIDCKELKSNLTAEQTTLLVSSIGGSVSKENNKEIIFSSICCKLDAEQHKKKLYYYTETKMFHCYKCAETYDIFSLIEQRWTLENREYDFANIVNYIATQLNIKETKKSAEWKKLKKYLSREQGGFDNTIHDDSIVRFFDRNIYSQQWIDEGISVETMRKFNIGFYELPQQITIPIRDVKGRLTGVHCRNLLPDVVKAGFKYLPLRMLDNADYRFKSSTNLYGIYENKDNIIGSKTVIITESPKSVLQAENILEKNNTVAIFGMSMSKRQREIILELGVNKVIIALDKQYLDIYDKEGNYTQEFDDYRKKIKKIKELFKGYTKVHVLYDKNNVLRYKDSPFDRGRENYERLWENASKRIDE